MVFTQDCLKFSDNASINFSLSDIDNISVTLSNGTTIDFFKSKYFNIVFSDSEITLELHIGIYIKYIIKIAPPVSVGAILFKIHECYCDFISDQERSKIPVRENDIIDTNDIVLTNAIIKQINGYKRGFNTSREYICKYVLSSNMNTEEFIKMSQDELDNKLYRYELQTFHKQYNGLIHKTDDTYYVSWQSPK